MSEERVICSHHLSIRFEQLEGNRVNWYVEPDDEVLKAHGLSLIDKEQQSRFPDIIHGDAVSG
jgi:hypothetical protein